VEKKIRKSKEAALLARLVPQFCVAQLTMLSAIRNVVPTSDLDNNVLYISLN